ncbi:MAG: AzlC family ABC transporter permease [Anaerolineales bacterium]
MSALSRAAWREFAAGARDQLPILAGVVPFGLIFGALAVGSGLSALVAQGFSLFIFAGSAQFVAVSLIAGAAPMVVVIGTIWIVNLRHLLYSASLAPQFSPLPARWRIPLAWLLTDEAFAVGSARYQGGDLRFAHWYFLGTGLTLWSAWQASTAVGILLRARVPTSWQLDFALPLTFLALLVPMLRDRPAIAAAAAAGSLAVILGGLPDRIGLLIAAAAGVGAGILLEGCRRLPGRSSQ